MATKKIVWCLTIYADKTRLGSALEVECEEDDSIAKLKEKVKDKMSPDLNHVAANRLDVWQCEERKFFSEADEEEIEKFLEDINLSDKSWAVRLPSGSKVKNIKLGDGEVLLVQVPNNQSSKRRHDKISNGEEETEISSKRSKYLQEQDANAKAAQKSFTPSEASKHKYIRTQQSNAPVFNGRPPQYTGPPIGLSHEVFNRFQADLESAEPIKLDIRQNVRKLIILSGEVYDNEQARFDEIESILNDLFGGKLMSVNSKKATSDSVLVATFTLWVGYTLIFELKNEIGTGGADPFVQATFAYQQYWSNEKSKELRERSYCPSMLVAIAGPWICIGGAVYKQTPIAEPLTDYIYMGHGNQSRLERVFRSLRNAVASLHHLYAVTLPSTNDDGPCGYPYVCEYNGRRFSYVKKLDGGCDEKEVYLVKEGDKSLVVKFATRYNEVAHRLLAESIDGERFAPALHHVSAAEYGGRRMVVMDYVEGEMALGVGLSSRHRGQIERALNRLHAAGLVFGDLRLPNIMISGDRLMLIDFDWCGKDGEATYPKEFNTSDISWADGMGPGLTMRKEHDMHMLDNLNQ